MASRVDLTVVSSEGIIVSSEEIIVRSEAIVTSTARTDRCRVVMHRRPARTDSCTADMQPLALARPPVAEGFTRIALEPMRVARSGTCVAIDGEAVHFLVITVPRQCTAVTARPSARSLEPIAVTLRCTAVSLASIPVPLEWIAIATRHPPISRAAIAIAPHPSRVALQWIRVPLACIGVALEQ